jgi:hypothetical protein
MDCINGYIGVKGCPGEENPPSGMFINHLPGVSFKSLVGLTDFDANTVRELWLQIQNLAGEILVGDVVASIRFKYNLKTSRRTINMPSIHFGGSSALVDEERGVAIDLHTVRSQFNHIYISTIKFYLHSLPTPNVDGDSQVRFVFKDVYGNPLLKMFVTVLPEQVGETITVQVMKRFPVNFLFIGASGDGFSTTDSTLDPIAVHNFCQTFCEICPDCKSTLTGAIFKDGAYSFDGNAHGMGLVAGVGCSYDSLVCANLDWFKMPLLFLCGNLIMVERLSSDRVNKWTTIGQASAEELRDAYRTEYETRLKDILTGMELDPFTDCCIECEQTIKRKVYLP